MSPERAFHLQREIRHPARPRPNVEAIIEKPCERTGERPGDHLALWVAFDLAAPECSILDIQHLDAADGDDATIWDRVARQESECTDRENADLRARAFNTPDLIQYGQEASEFAEPDRKIRASPRV